MKRLISLLIALCMVLPVLVSCGEPTPPTPTEPPIMVYVSPNGDNATATGIHTSPFGTIQAAVDYAAENDDKFLGITIILKSGTYTLAEPVKIGDVGSAECTITIIGEDGAKIVGGTAESFITLADANYLAIDNLAFESSTGSGIVGTADHLHIRNCEITGVQGDYAIDIKGSNLSIYGNYIHDLKRSAIHLDSGDLENLVYSDSDVRNNYIRDWGLDNTQKSDAISAAGVGIEVAHNACHNSSSSAIELFGAYNTVEYNHVYDVLTAPSEPELGAVTNYGYCGNVIRYNYIHHVGIPTETVETVDPHTPTVAAIHWNGELGFTEAYGNIIETVLGNGIKMNGRHLNVHGNLIIDCSMWYVLCVSSSYAMALEEGYKGIADYYPDWIYSPVWRKANPDLSKIVTDLSQTTASDPWGWATTYGYELHTNWCHFNKYGRAFSNWGARPYYVEDHVYTFSPDTVTIPPDGTDPDRTSSFNSRRGKPDIEKLLTETALGVVSLTWEEFSKIGVDPSAWTHSTELPPLVVPEE